MNKLPITLALFTSSKGHFGRKTDYKLTLNHWDKQIPLSQFNLIAHVKVTPGDEVLADEMKVDLERRGFHVLTTVAAWNRGLSHGSEYLRDMTTLSKDPKVYQSPYFLLLEDDSLAISHQLPLIDLLLKSCQMLSDNHELLSVRLLRRHDNQPSLGDVMCNPDCFYSPNTDFQPLIMRSLDFYRLCMVLEANPKACEQTHCEMLWRLILDQFSRSQLKHVLYKADHAETIHIGVPQEEHDKLVQTHNLT